MKNRILSFSRFLLLIIIPLFLSIRGHSQCEIFNASLKAFNNGKNNNLEQLIIAENLSNQSKNTSCYKQDSINNKNISLLMRIRDEKNKILIQQKLKDKSYQEARKLLVNAPDSLYQYFPSKTENDFLKESFKIADSTFLKLDKNNVKIAGKVFRVNPAKELEKLDFNDLTYLSVSSKGNLIGANTDKRLLINENKIDGKTLVDKQIDVPIFAFDESGECVYYANRSNFNEIFVRCKKDTSYKLPFSLTSFFSGFRLDYIHPKDTLLILRRTIKEMYTSMIFWNFIDDKNFLEFLFFEKRYNEFKLIGKSNQKYLISAFDAKSQVYDFYWIGKGTKNTELKPFLEKITTYKNLNDSLYFLKGNDLFFYYSSTDEKLLSKNVEPNFDCNNQWLAFWEIQPKSKFEWELKILDLETKVVSSSWFRYLSAVNNPPKISVFDGFIILNDGYRVSYLDIKARKGKKLSELKNYVIN